MKSEYDLGAEVWILEAVDISSGPDRITCPACDGMKAIHGYDCIPWPCPACDAKGVMPQCATQPVGPMEIVGIDMKESILNGRSETLCEDYCLVKTTYEGPTRHVSVGNVYATEALAHQALYDEARLALGEHDSGEEAAHD